MQLTSDDRRAAKKNRWWLGLGVIVVLLVAGVLVLTIRSNIEATQVAMETQMEEAATAVFGNLSASVSATGQVESAHVANLSAETTAVVETVLVREGDRVQAGDILIQLETADLEFRVAKMAQNLTLQEAELEALQNGSTQEDIAAAEAAVASAKRNLENLLAGPTEQAIAESEATIRSQQANVASASATYSSAVDSATDSAVAAAEIDLLNAQYAYDEALEAYESSTNSRARAALRERLNTATINLTVAQAAMDDLLRPNQGNVNSAAASVSAATANLEQAQANYDKLLLGATASQIAAAEAALAQAESALVRLVEPASAEDVAIAEAEVEQARLALLDAEESLAKATIVAPFAGVVTAVHVSEGEMGAGTLVQLMSASYQIVLSVDEVDVGAIMPGQKASLTLETWPDVDIESEVVSIAPSGSSDGNLVAYDVTLQLDDTDLPILAGMTANAKLTTASYDRVLLVPNAAITADREQGTYSVNRIIGEQNGRFATETVAVTIGFKDSRFTQITSGLSEGDEVVIGELSVPIQRFDGPGPFGGNGEDS